MLGKGAKERLIPFGEVAALWLQRYLEAARPRCWLAETAMTCSSRSGNPPSTAMTRAMFWLGGAPLCDCCWYWAASVAARCMPLQRIYQSWCRPACRAAAAGACRHIHHDLPISPVNAWLPDTHSTTPRVNAGWALGNGSAQASACRCAQLIWLLLSPKVLADSAKRASSPVSQSQGQCQEQCQRTCPVGQSLIDRVR